MTTDMTTTSNNQVGFPTNSDPFAKAARDLGVNEGSFLRFDGNTGDFTYGPKDDTKDLAHGTLLAVNMTTFKRGWICWKEGEAVEEVMVPILEGEPPAETTLTDHGPYETYDDGTSDGWQSQNGIELRSVDTGEMFTYKGTSKSAGRAFGNLLDAFAKVYRQKPNQVPVIEISANAFEPKVKGKDGKPGKKIGKKYAPVLKIVSWMPMSEFLALIDVAAAAAEKATDSTDTTGADDAANYATEGTTDASQENGEQTEVGGARRGRRV